MNPREASFEIERHPVITSTNERCLDLARNGAPAWTVVTADAQSEGRGQRSRPWQSPRGGLYLSVLLRPKLPPARAALLTLAGGVALLNTIEPLASQQTGLKWPNDLLVAEHPNHSADWVGRKLAGILVEGSMDSGRIAYLVLGLGLNLEGKLEPPALDLATILGETPDRDTLLQAFLAALYGQVLHLEAGASPQWNEAALGLGSPVRVTDGEVSHAGTFLGIDSFNGALRLEQGLGEVRTFAHGRVSELALHRGIKIPS